MTDKIKLVSKRDPKEVAAQHARRELSAATKELAANILRVIAGARSTYKIIDQVVPVVAASERLNELTGNALASHTAIEEALRSLDWRAGNPKYTRPNDDALARWERDGSTDLDRAIDVIVQAALRLVAAQLCAQPTPESRSRNQLMEAVRHYNNALAVVRRRPKP